MKDGLKPYTLTQRSRMNPPKKNACFLLGSVIALIALSLTAFAHEEQALSSGEVFLANERMQDRSTLFDLFVELLRSFSQRYWLDESTEHFLSQKDTLLNSIVNESNLEKKFLKMHAYDQFLHEHRGINVSLPYSDSQRMLLTSLNQIYEENDPKSNLIKSIIEEEIPLVAKNKNMTELLDISLVCDGLSSKLTHGCYHPILQEITRKDRESIKKTLTTLKDRWFVERDVEQCHYLAHEAGFALYDLYGLEGANSCPGVYDECSYGCYHGIAQEFVMSTYSKKIDSILNSPDYRTIIEAEPSYGIWSLHHGMGHALHELHHDLEKSFGDCDVLGDGSPSRAKSCYYGVSHEFSSYLYDQNMSLVEASKHCPSDGIRRRTCFYMLGFTYAAKEGIAKAVTGCNPSNEPPCFVGVAMVLGVESGSLPKSVNICRNLFSKEMLPYCYEGLALSYIYTDNNLNRALEICSLDNSSHCYEYLRRVYANDLWFNGALCDNVDASHRQECEKNLHGVTRLEGQSAR